MNVGKFRWRNQTVSAWDSRVRSIEDLSSYDAVDDHSWTAYGIASESRSAAVVLLSQKSRCVRRGGQPSPAKVGRQMRLLSRTTLATELCTRVRLGCPARAFGCSSADVRDTKRSRCAGAAMPCALSEPQVSRICRRPTVSLAELDGSSAEKVCFVASSHDYLPRRRREHLRICGSELGRGRSQSEGK
jgi:hypothetical protein